MSYRRRLSRDIDRWIALDLVPASSRVAMLEAISTRTAPRARSLLAMTGLIMAACAIIALIADNWSGIPRALQMACLSALTITSLWGAGQFRDSRPGLANGLASTGLLLFASTLALMGQAFNMPGSFEGLMLAVAVAGVLIARAGRVEGPAVLSAIALLVWLTNSWGGLWTGGVLPDPGLGVAIAIVAALIFLTRHTGAQGSLLHGTVIASASVGFLVLHELIWTLEAQFSSAPYRFGLGSPAMEAFLGAGLILALGVALLGYRAWRREAPGGSTVMSYAALIALTLIAVFRETDLFSDTFATYLAHTFLWIGTSVAAIWMGGRLPHGVVLAGGCVSLAIAALVIMQDLALDLMLVAGVFALIAGIILTITFTLHRNGTDKTGDET